MILLLLLAQLQAVSAAEMKALVKPAARPLVVHAWASWCGPCVAELPELAAGLRKRRVDVLWVNLDQQPEKAEKLLAKLKLPGQSVRPATNEAFVALRALDEKWEGELPATWIINESGVEFSQRGISNLEELFNQIGKTRRGK
jgi:thiol-disulfide isomerase/thioredoxin